MIKYIRSIIAAIITSSLLWSLWTNYNSVLLIAGLELECQDVLIRSKTAFNKVKNQNTIVYDFYRTNNKDRLERYTQTRDGIQLQHTFTLTDDYLIDSISHYNNKIEIEWHVFSRTAGSSYCGFGQTPSFYKDYLSDIIYLGSPINFNFEPMTKYDLHINNKPVDIHYKKGYTIPKSDSYNIEIQIIQFNLSKGVLDTTLISKVIENY